MTVLTGEQVDTQIKTQLASNSQQLADLTKLIYCLEAKPANRTNPTTNSRTHHSSTRITRMSYNSGYWNAFKFW